MKKLFAIILTLCMLSSLFCIGVSADSSDASAPAAGTVMRVSFEKKDGTVEIMHDFGSFVEGWNYAMGYATPTMLNLLHCKQMIVDIYADWNAVDGEFSDDDGYGFKWDTIYIPEQAVVTLNLNGHTINRGLTDWEYNGEVISIEENARVTINGGKDDNDITEGTIRGGYSCNGGGGIHVSEGASLTLNYVNVTNNNTEDDDGAGIHLEEKATLMMFYGSLADNRMDATLYGAPSGGGLYTEYNCYVRLYSVDIRNNNAHPDADVTPIGAAIRARGDIWLSNCTIENNGLTIGDDYSAQSIVVLSGTVQISDCVFRNNGALYTDEVTGTKRTTTELLYLTGDVTMRNCEITGNKNYNLFYAHTIVLDMENCTFTNNSSPRTMYAEAQVVNGITLNIRNCTFNNNGHPDVSDIEDFLVGDENVTSENNDFGDSTFDSPVKSKFTGTMLGDTSFSMVISLIALTISIAAIVLLVVDKKKKNAKTEA